MAPRDHVLKAKELRIREMELRLRQGELEHRNWEVRFKAKADYTDNGIRGLVLVNGGSAVALGAFLQAIIAKPEAATLVLYVLLGLAMNGAGVACAASVFYLRYKQSLYEDQHRKYLNDNPWWHWTWRLASLSLFFFVAAILVIAFGGLKWEGSVVRAISRFL